MLLIQKKHYKSMFFFYIRDQEIVNTLDMVLIIKSETRVGDGVVRKNPRFYH
jgi:hypothetical protein